MVVPLKIPLTWHISEDPKAKDRPLVVFVHNYGGSAETSWRHTDLLKKLGFNSVTFNLSFNGKPRRFRWPWNLIMGWGDEINQVLDEVHAYHRKILYCFSGPAASGLHALANRLEVKQHDVVKFICDSGPFLDAYECSRYLLEDFYKVKNAIVREIRLFFMMLVWGYSHNRQLKKSAGRIHELEPKLPILSFRGLQDKIVPVEKIDRLFKEFFPKTEVVSLECGHLRGLKDRGPEYEKALKGFLAR